MFAIANELPKLSEMTVGRKILRVTSCKLLAISALIVSVQAQRFIWHLEDLHMLQNG